MSRCKFWMTCASPLAAVVLTTVFATLSAPSAWGAPGGSESARLQSYVSPDGQSYYALALAPPIAAPPANNTSILVLVGTAASQGGE